MRRIALAMQGRAPAQTPRDPTGETARRGYIFDDLFSRRYDEAILDRVAQHVVRRRLPPWARLAAEINRRSDEYDAIVTWSERVTLALMTVQSLSGRGKPHVPMMYWFSRPSVRPFMRAFAKSLPGIVTWSSVQRRYAIDRLGIAPERLYLVKHFVDQLFWSPRKDARELDVVASAGAEMRDYPTLLEAMRGTELRCHIATDHVRVDRFGFARRVSATEYAKRAGGNVAIGRLSPTELRDLYARSRFVVVPVRRSDTDNGVTVILEAMAMGKPVICSRTEGQVDVIQEGVTGLFVPVGDPVALRKAMLSLWNEPERAAAMGRAGRAYIEKHHTLEKFSGDVLRAVNASLDGEPAAVDGSLA
jgi:glycosyltransferase involved in cell wall biosynthesis